jgi:hypothetical protein
MSSRLKLLSFVLPALFVLAFTACSSSNNKSSSNNSGSSNANTSSQASAGKKLSACDYAGQVVKAFSTLGAAALTSPSGDANAAKNTVNSVVGGTKQALSDLQSITPPDDFKQFHADFVAAIQDVVNQLQDAQKSLDAGDPTKALSSLSTSLSGFTDKADQLQKKYPSQTKKLDACPSATS